VTFALNGQMSKSRRQRTAAEPDVWYAAGLRFECTQCNQCCTGAPGYVWVSKGEIARIAAFVGMSPRELTRRYCRNVWWSVSLKERPNGDCVFLTPQGCSIYPVRPAQCRTFPFWPHNLSSPDAWKAVAERCPGVGRGRLYTRREIEAIAEGKAET